jgi:hypothetical protein
MAMITFSATALVLFFLSRSPPHALEVTGDLDKQEIRDGRSVKDLGTGLTGCDGGVDGRLREEVFSPTFPSYLRQDQSHAGATIFVRPAIPLVLRST